MLLDHIHGFVRLGGIFITFVTKVTKSAVEFMHYFLLFEGFSSVSFSSAQFVPQSCFRASVNIYTVTRFRVCFN